MNNQTKRKMIIGVLVAALLLSGGALLKLTMQTPLNNYLEKAGK